MTKKKPVTLVTETLRILTSLDGVVGGVDNSSKRCDLILTASYATDRR